MGLWSQTEEVLEGEQKVSDCLKKEKVSLFMSDSKQVSKTEKQSYRRGVTTLWGLRKRVDWGR